MCLIVLRDLLGKMSTIKKSSDDSCEENIFESFLMLNLCLLLSFLCGLYLGA